MRAADIVANWLKEINDHVFLVTGGGSMYLNDAIGKCGIKYVCTHHEQAAAMAAEAYARISGRAGLCMVTAGPGSTNAITGLFGAYTDSIPMIFVSGQMKRETLSSLNTVNGRKLRQIGDQEVDIIPIVEHLTKYAVEIHDPKDLRHILDIAKFEACHGRPGPVWISVPLDVQQAEVDFIEKLGGSNFIDVMKFDATRITKVVRELTNARRPVVIVGHGIRLDDAMLDLHSLLEKTKIPALPAFNAIDLITLGSAGPFGTIGTRAANTILKEADCMLILGCRMNIRQIGYDFGEVGKNALKIMVDIDSMELRKHTFKPDIPICWAVKKFLEELNEELVFFPIKEDWIKRCQDLILQDHIEMPLLPDKDNYVNPYRIIQHLNTWTQEGDIVVTANAMASIAAAQMLQIKKDMRFIANSGAGSMGYGLPASVGAAFAAGDRRIICLEGDGSIQMNIQELQTIIHHNLPIKILIFNNDGYQSIRNTQDNYFEGYYVGADKFSGVSFPNMKQIAKAYGLAYYWAHENRRIVEALRVTMNHKGPIICEFCIDPKAKPMPKGLYY